MTLDGQSLPFKTLELANGKLSGEEIPDSLVLDDLRLIEVAAGAPAPPKSAIQIELRGEGRIFAKAVRLADDKCHIDWSQGEPLVVPIDAVRAIRFESGTSYPELDKAIAAPSAELDRIFLKSEGGKIDSISGLVDSMDDKEVVLEIESQRRPILRQRLFAIVVAQPTAQDAATGCVISLQDGSQLGGDLVAIGGGEATLSLPGGAKAEFPWSAISRIEIRSSRIAFLSDLKPIAVEQEAIVTLPRPWQRDKNVLGRPLKIGDRQFEKGIGVHARSSLTFAADGNYDVLAAIVGIDAATGGKGDCNFTVLADGQPLWTRRVKGTDPPHEVRVDLKRASQVTLLVEPGADLDLADHANWCDVRFIKNRE